MIQVKKLQQNNYLLLQRATDKIIVQVVSYSRFYDIEFSAARLGEDPHKIVSTANNRIYNEYDSKYSFILISDKVLQQLSFIKDNYGVFYITEDSTNTSKSKIELWMKKCKVNDKWFYDVSIGNSISNTTHICFIKYLHELQNLYSLLKKKDLILTA